MLKWFNGLFSKTETEDIDYVKPDVHEHQKTT